MTVRLIAGVAVACCLAISPAAAGGAEALSQIWALGSSAPDQLVRGELERRVREADIVLAGENHDNGHHHEGQAAIVRAAADDRPVIVVFEMLERAQQPQIDAYISDGGDAAGFAEAVSWKSRGWPDADLYWPLFEAIFDIGATVVAGDLSRDEIRKVGRGGLDAAPSELVGSFGLDTSLDPATEAQMRDIQFEAHCELMPREAMAPMVGVQRLRDAALTDALFKARQRDPQARVVLIAGAGHVRNDHGVGALLQAAAPETRVLTVGFEESETEIDPDSASQWRDLYDVLWITRPANRPDPCEELKRQMGHAR